jgi:hypothetical protein
MWLFVVIDAHFEFFSHFSIPQDWKGVLMSRALAGFTYLLPFSLFFASFILAKVRLLEAN